MLSIIVPVYSMRPEVRDLWQRNLNTIFRVAQMDTEVVSVDNGSTCPPTPPATVTWPTNKGVAPAWNEGVRRANGDVLAFVTSTTAVEAGWDTALAAVARSGRYIAMPYTNGTKPYGIGVTGWCWAVRRNLWEAVGPFDETFVPVQYEDTDFFMRATRDHGIELVNVPAARVTRAARRQTWHGTGFDEKAKAIHMANRWRFAWKHGVPVEDVPPFWKTPLRDVEVPA